MVGFVIKSRCLSGLKLIGHSNFYFILLPSNSCFLEYEFPNIQQAGREYVLKVRKRLIFRHRYKLQSDIERSHYSPSLSNILDTQSFQKTPIRYIGTSIQTRNHILQSHRVFYIVPSSDMPLHCNFDAQ